MEVESVILSQFNWRLSRLKSSEADGRRLPDHTSVLCGSNLGDANNHDYRNLPIMLAGGGSSHGYYVTFERSDNQPLSDLSLALLHNIGVEVPRFGTSRGRLDWS